MDLCQLAYQKILKQEVKVNLMHASLHIPHPHHRPPTRHHHHHHRHHPEIPKSLIFSHQEPYTILQNVQHIHKQGLDITISTYTVLEKKRKIASVLAK